MDLYEGVYSKLALALTSSQVAKQQVVAEFGVGEDLPFLFLGWCGDELGVMGGLGSEHMSLSVLERLPFVGSLVGLMRSGFLCDSFCFVAEGFLSRDVGLSSGRDLGVVFGGGFEGVVECLSVVHVELVGGEPRAVLMSVPYVYEGRDVVWGEGSFFERGVGRVLRDSPVLAVLLLGLGEVPGVLSVGEWEGLVEGVLGLGLSFSSFVEPGNVGW